MEHDNPINIKYRNTAQDRVYEAEFETLLAAEMFMSSLKSRQCLELVEGSGY